MLQLILPSLKVLFSFAYAIYATFSAYSVPLLGGELFICFYVSKKNLYCARFRL